MKISAHISFMLMVLVFMALNPLAARATEVKGLYQASMAVADRSDAERKRAVGEGFQQVLVRVSGDSAVAMQDTVLTVAANADRYVVQYGYETRSDTPSDQPGVFLNVQYDPNGINDLLRRNSLPLWSSNRPKILIWMGWEQGLDRELVNANAMQGPFQMLQIEGKRRGVTLAFPEFDPDDQSHVSLGDIWGMFPEPVLAASERYQTPVVLMAKVRESATAIQINAMLQLDGQPFWFEVARSDTTSALRQLVDLVVDKVGAHYALVTSAELSQQVVLQVDGVVELKDYAALTRYLDSLLAITQYRTLRVQGENTGFLITLASGLEALEQSLRLDRKLLPSLVEPVVRLEAREPVVPAPDATLDADEGAEMPAAPTSGPRASGPLVIRYHWRG